MRFWDTSAVVPILISDPRSRDLLALLKSDRECWAFWATRTECFSVLQHRLRDGELSSKGFDEGKKRLEQFDSAANLVMPVEAVRERADRLLGSHPLRAADALQLAAAIVASEERPSDLPFVTLDEWLSEAARREGFTVLPDVRP